jgi:beta-lactam-binding protein with PASTA domain
VGLAVIIVVTVVLVLALGLLIFTLMRKSQKVVPHVADDRAADRDRVVATDDEGRPVTESQEEDDAPRDDVAFESVLKDELEDLGR